MYFLPAAHPQRGMEEAVVRLREYARAGADGAFAPGLIDPGDIATLVTRIDRPLNVYAGYAGVPPVATCFAASKIARACILVISG